MDLKELLEGLRARAPWLSAGRPILQWAGYPILRGYENTIDNALEEDEDADREDRLYWSLVEHLVVGEKQLSLYKVSAAERDALAQWVSQKRTTNTQLTGAFPAIASADVVRANKDVPPQSLGGQNLEAGSAALFTSARSYLSQIELPPSTLKDGNKGDFEKIIGIQRIYVQTYDAIWIPPSGTVVCIAVDYPEAAPRDFPQISLIALEAMLRKQLNRPLEPINLWPAVDGLYQSDEGKLVEYGFVTGDDSVKHHKARRGARCLRQTIYDAAGADAVGDDLVVFKAAIEWNQPVPKSPRSHPEILLPGVARLLNKANAQLPHAILRNCLTSRDLEFVVSKLKSHTK